MKTRRLLRLLMFFSVAIFILSFAPPLRCELIYTWTDKNGGVHFTDEPSEIPLADRSRVKTMTMPDHEEGPPPQQTTTSNTPSSDGAQAKSSSTETAETSDSNTPSATGTQTENGSDQSGQKAQQSKDQQAIDAAAGEAVFEQKLREKQL